MNAIQQIALNKDTIEILGRPNFMCANAARILRLRGDTIPHKAENEQAAVICFLLNLYLEHGSGYLKKAEETLTEILESKKNEINKTHG